MELRAQAVLFRTGHDSDLLELELTRRGIPFVKYGGLRFLDAAHVKDLIAMLRLTDNPADEVSWFRLLQLLEGVGPIRARRVLDALRAPGGGPPELSRWPQAAAHVPDSSREHAGAMIDALARAGVTGTAGAHVERCCAALTPLIRLRYPDGAVRVSDLDQLVAASRSAEDVRHFVSELVLDPPISSADLAGPPHLDEDYLVLSTVHSAKGLEWEAVHLIGAYDGNFPADMSTANEEGVAEERRLFYVALTRARRRLHVYVPFRYYHRARGRDDAHGYGQASRFLSDAVQDLFTVTRTSEASAGRSRRGAFTASDRGLGGRAVRLTPNRRSGRYGGPMAEPEAILRSAYRAFNARDLDAALELMHPEVDWPNAWEGGRVVGRAAVRDYWTRQFAAISSEVEPRRFIEEADGSVTVEVDQVVRDAHTHALLSDSVVRHRYRLREGLIVRMDVLEPNVEQ